MTSVALKSKASLCHLALMAQKTTAMHPQRARITSHLSYEGVRIIIGVLLILTMAIHHSLRGEALNDILCLKALHCLSPNLSWVQNPCFNLKPHLHPNGLATVCYCFQMVLLFSSRSDWLPEYSCEWENCQIGGAMSHRCTLRSCPNLRPQFTNL